MRGRLLGTAACVTLLGLAGLAGCSTSVEPSSQAAAPRPAAMEFETRKQALPAEFPLEIPVIAGRVISAESQGADGLVWTYRIETPGDAAVVGAWYRSAYTNANWVIHTQNGDDSVQEMVFRKGRGAETAIRIESDGITSTVQASIGIGVPVTGEM